MFTGAICIGNNTHLGQRKPVFSVILQKPGLTHNQRHKLVDPHINRAADVHLHSLLNQTLQPFRFHQSAKILLPHLLPLPPNRLPKILHGRMHNISVHHPNNCDIHCVRTAV